MMAVNLTIIILITAPFCWLLVFSLFHYYTVRKLHCIIRCSVQVRMCPDRHFGHQSLVSSYLSGLLPALKPKTSQGVSVFKASRSHGFSPPYYGPRSHNPPGVSYWFLRFCLGDHPMIKAFHCLSPGHGCFFLRDERLGFSL